MASVSTGLAATTVTSIAPGSEGSYLTGMLIEDFEDVNLVSGLTVTLSVWRNASNAITGDPPVVYAGTLPQTYAPASDGFSLNAWDGTRALVNGSGHDWIYPFAASVELQFSPAVPSVGFGLSNFQTNVTSHTLYVNGVSQGLLDDLPGWVSGIDVKNRYVLVSGDLVTSIRITADTHFDGLIFDKLAFTNPIVPSATGSWGRLKSLFR